MEKSGSRGMFTHWPCSLPQSVIISLCVSRRGLPSGKKRHLVFQFLKTFITNVVNIFITTYLHTGYHQQFQ